MAGSKQVVRQDNWHQALKDEFEHSKSLPFQWGTNDCAHFAFRCLQAQTGVDYGKPFRKYKTIRGAYNLIRRYGGSDLETAFDRWANENGMEKIPVARAKRGDLICYQNPNGEKCMGVVALCGMKAYFLDPERGIHQIPVLNCLCAWGIN
jgi:hypothetical protein